MVDRGGLENRCTLAGTQGSNPCLSAINTDYQSVVKITPVFTPKKCEAGVFMSFGHISQKYTICDELPEEINHPRKVTGTMCASIIRLRLVKM